MKKKRRILIVEEDSLFSNGVKSLLARRENLEIIGVASPTDVQTLTAEIKRTRPNVVIISDELTLAQPRLVLTLLKAHPELRIIALSLEGNRINIYDNREVVVSTSDDLVTLITDTK